MESKKRPFVFRVENEAALQEWCVCAILGGRSPARLLLWSSHTSSHTTILHLLCVAAWLRVASPPLGSLRIDAIHAVISMPRPVTAGHVSSHCGWVTKANKKGMHWKRRCVPAWPVGQLAVGLVLRCSPVRVSA